jgi:hypothetical protein
MISREDNGTRTTNHMRAFRHFVLEAETGFDDVGEGIQLELTGAS